MKSFGVVQFCVIKMLLTWVAYNTDFSFTDKILPCIINDGKGKLGVSTWEFN